jgi:DNA polymerase-2
LRALIVGGIDGEGEITLFVRCEDGQKKKLKILYKAPESKYSAIVRFMIDYEIYYGVEFPLKDVLLPEEVKPCEVEIAPDTAFMDITFDGASPIAASIYHNKKMQIYIIDPQSKEPNGEEIRYLPDERVLVKEVNTYLDQIEPDVIAGWDVKDQLNRYEKRAKQLGIETKFTFERFDIFEQYEWKLRPLSDRLNDIALDEGLVQKGEMDEYNEVLQEYKNKKIGSLVSFSSKRAYLSSRIENKYKFLSYVYGLKRVVGVHTLDLLRSSIFMVTITMMRVAKKKGLEIPTIKGDVREEESPGYVGALVLTPPVGRFENVAVLDMSRFFPSLMLDFNISPETSKVVKPDPEHPIVEFTFDKIGLIPEAIRHLNSYRDEVESKIKALKPDNPQVELLKIDRMAVKGVMNSFYGVLGNEGFVYHNMALASKISELGREGLTELMNESKRRGHEVYYADTDGFMVSVEYEKAQGLAKDLTNHIREYFKEKYHLPKCENLTLKFEQYLKAIIFHGVKKTYAKWVIWENEPCDKIELVGLVKNNRSAFSLKFMEELYSAALRGATNLQEIIDRALTKIRQASYEELALHTGVSRPLKEYKVKPPHIRAMEFSNEVLGTNFNEKTRVKWLWIKGYPDHPRQNVIGFEYEKQLPPHLKLDWKHLEEVSIKLVAKQMSEVLGKEVVTRQRSLSEY